MMVVQIEKPANTTLAMLFAELRSWFDENNCQPTMFSQSNTKMDILLFDVTFDNTAHARLFASTFTKYEPSIRGTTSVELSGLSKSRNLAV
jgi:hypothetical protein